MNKIQIKDFCLGGLSDGKFSGVKNSVYKMVGFDLHSTPRLLKVRQKLTKEASGTYPDELCKVILPCSDGNTYFFSSTSGKVWKRTSGGTWTLHDTTASESNYGGSIVLGAYEYKGFVYWWTDNRVFRIAVSNTANWATQAETEFAKLDAAIEIDFTTNINTYTLPTSISESAVDKYEFVATHRKITGVALQKETKGTGDWTVEIHDSVNTVIATKTITNASLSVSDLNLYHFQFTTPAEVTVGDTYHIHIKVSTGTSKVYSVTASSWALGAANIYTTYNTSYHPAVEQNQVLYIGDNNFLHQIDDGVFTRDALDIPEEYIIKCLGKIATNVLIGTYSASNINRGALFDWNTWSVSYSNWDQVDEVGINAFLPADNAVYVHAGVAGNIYKYNGSYLELWKKIEGDYSSSATITVHPNAVANIEGQILFGLSQVAGNPVELGVYNLGRHDNKYPHVIDLSYPISERSGGNFVMSGIEIGAIAVSGSDVFVAWKNGSSYGVDKTDSSNKLSGAYFETRAMSADRFMQSTYVDLKVAYETLPDSTSIVISQKANHTTNYTVVDTIVDTDRKIVASDNNQSFLANIFQMKVSIVASSNNAPTIEEAEISVQ